MPSVAEIKCDHRKSVVGVRDQGQRSSCLAFAASDVNAYTNNLDDYLSPEYLIYYACQFMGTQELNSGLTTESVYRSLDNLGQPYEVKFPYKPEADKALTRPSDNDEYQPLYQSCFHQIMKPDFDQIVSMLDSKRLVLMVLGITRCFMAGSHPGLIEPTPSDKLIGVHAVVAVGHGVVDNTPSILIKNSWGSRWANEGFSWLSKQYIEKFCNEISYAEAK